MGNANKKLQWIHTHTHTHTHTHKSNPNTILKMVIKLQEKRTKEEGGKKTYKNKPKTIKKMAIGTQISITTLNVNGLNTPIKRPRLAEWIQKQDHIYAVYKSPTSDLGTHTD